LPSRTLTAKEIPTLLRKGKIRIAVIGLGRIGLPTAASFAKAGAQVTGVDLKKKVVDETNAGRCWLTDEPGLADLVGDAVRSGRLRATLSAKDAVANADFTIICVPTPVYETKTPDYTAIQKASKALGAHIRRGSVVIVESTVGPGIVEEMVGPILEDESGMRAGRDFGLVACPERSDPGNIMQNMKTLPRIIGGIGPGWTDATVALYEASLGVKAIRVSDPKTANAAKLTENLFRDVNIALANEFALLFEELGVDTIEVINACASKYNFMPHYPGMGVGGPGLPANSYYLISEGIKAGNIPYLIRMAREINDRMPDHAVELIEEALNEAGKTVKGSKIVMMGVAYKPNIKDVQLSPVERAIIRLRAMGARVEIYDPMFKGEEVLGLKGRATLEAAARGADCFVIGTAHDEFRHLDLDELSRLARMKAAFVDARNVVSPIAVLNAGFAFRGVGRRPLPEPS
jgi:nucleotide sugar dehydrogenase